MGRSRSLGEDELTTMTKHQRDFRILSHKLSQIHGKMEHVIRVDQDQIINGNNNFKLIH